MILLIISVILILASILLLRVFYMEVFAGILLAVSVVTIFCLFIAIAFNVADSKELCDNYKTYKDYYYDLSSTDKKNIAAVTKIYEYNEDIIYYKWLISESYGKMTWNIVLDKRIKDLEIIK